MRAGFLLLSLLVSTRAAVLSMVRVASFPEGAAAMVAPVCADWDLSGRQDVMLHAGGEVTSMWKVWTDIGLNQYAVALVETTYFNRTGIWPGGFIPSAAGDVDGDGLPDCVGHNWEFVDTVASSWNVAVAMESPWPGSIPTRLTWRSRLAFQHTGISPACIVPSLDRDSLADVVVTVTNSESLMGIRIYESRGDDSLAFVWCTGSGSPSRSVAGDFDLDGRMEVAISHNSWVETVECVGNDQYWVPPWRDDLPVANGIDVFYGRDTDRNGKPEFFVNCARWLFGNWRFYLYRYEATWDNVYERTFVDSADSPDVWGWVSCCGDVDGDGFEEVVWSAGRVCIILKATGPGRYERVYSRLTQSNIMATVADLNGNGYNEVILSSRETDIMEVEAIRVLAPNGGPGRSFVPGESCAIRWRLYVPPRCDSVSLFLRRGAAWRLDTIARGLAPGDSSYQWVVPDVWAESARVVAIAYGPGWQYDQSDSTFAIAGSDVAEERSGRRRRLRLSVMPNPARGRAVVACELPVEEAAELAVLDVAGRLVVRLASGRTGAGEHRFGWDLTDGCGRRVGTGVYFIRLDAGGERRVAKVVVENE